MEPNDKMTNSTINPEVNDVSEADQAQSNELADSTPIPSRKDARQKKAYRETVEWIKAIAIAVVLVFIVRTFLFSPFIVDGASMEPNFHTKERVIVNLLIYKISKPSYGDVVVFDVPEEGRRFIKRVIGVPGDTIEVHGDDVYVNGERIEEPYLEEAIAESHERGETYNGQSDYFSFPNDYYQDNVVPEGHYFVMGDNRSDSKDSRAIGYVSEDEIIGRADIVMWPLAELKLIKHYN
ncbi:signal peptidase I [Paenibacillus montaniterrae]|uniref:Signal peptidase I n=1 Tax=Paenibacillus montaniterrae TaxID=429341 RepID=A0A920CV11_9BACL|nr:signal peptidase I [Paenibacillus montaniterrae]GIP14526.1 signal peptidase I [Paenibacillus montaniterrae]